MVEIQKQASLREKLMHRNDEESQLDDDYTLLKDSVAATDGTEY